MQALYYLKPGKLEWRDTAAPTVQKDSDAILRPIAVAACDLDRLITGQGSPFPGPFILGPEFCAEVVAVGREVCSLAPGDKVIASFQPSCGTCPSCHVGHSSVCRSVPITSMYGIGGTGGDWGGAMAALVRVPWAEFNLRKIPASLDPRVIASGSDNLADALRAVDKPLQDRPGSSVLVAGVGSIPLYALVAAKFLGAGTISFASNDPFALATADALGVDCLEVTQWPKRFASHDITFDCTNNVAGLSAVVKSTAPYGVMTIASIYFAATTPVPLSDMYMKGINMHTGRVNSASQLERVLELLVAGLDPAGIAPAYAPMAEAIDVFAETPRSQKLIFTQS